MDKKKGELSSSKIKGGAKMAVSKATLACVQGQIGTRLIKDIQGTTVNSDIVKSCKKLMDKLAKGEIK